VREDAAWAVGSLAFNGRRAHVRFVVQSGAVEALCHLVVAAASSSHSRSSLGTTLPAVGYFASIGWG
jgi:hypothetical protein